jgi:hypothetical protein
LIVHQEQHLTISQLVVKIARQEDFLSVAVINIHLVED